MHLTWEVVLLGMQSTLGLLGACTQQDGKDIHGFDTGSSGPRHAEYFGFVWVHAHSRMARIFMDLTQKVVGPYM